MKAFIAATAVLCVTFFGALANDFYCRSTCLEIERSITENGENGAKIALEKFERNEFLLKMSVDNGYVSEAEVSLRSLNTAYAHKDGYESARYLEDALVRIRRVRRALII